MIFLQELVHLIHWPKQCVDPWKIALLTQRGSFCSSGLRQTYLLQTEASVYHMSC